MPPPTGMSLVLMVAPPCWPPGGWPAVGSAPWVVLLPAPVEAVSSLPPPHAANTAAAPTPAAPASTLRRVVSLMLLLLIGDGSLSDLRTRLPTGSRPGPIAASPFVCPIME